jgi:hypothetical protein
MRPVVRSLVFRAWLFVGGISALLFFLSMDGKGAWRDNVFVERRQPSTTTSG